MTEVTPVTRLFNSGSYEEDLYAKSLGWETPSMLILERAIVISVNLGIDINPTASYLPQFAINARLIGGTTSAYIPETEIPEWFFPLFPNSIVSLPEVGEQILVMKENIKNDSQGFWIGRVNDTDKVSFKGANAQLGAPGVTSMEQYGMRFRSNALHNRSPQPTAFANRPFFQIPARLGDVFMQGRNGTYIRHSYNPNYGPEGKPGILEMGVLQNRIYGNNEEPTLGKTRTKTVHFSNATLADTGIAFVKTTPNDDDITTTPGAGDDTFTVTRKNFIINTANEIYNISDMPDAAQSLSRQVLGEELNTYLLDENAKMVEILQTMNTMMDQLIVPMFGHFINHTHTLPAFDIDIPDKTFETEEVFTILKLEYRSPVKVKIPGQTIEVQAIAGGTVTTPGKAAVKWTEESVRQWHYNQGHQPATEIEFPDNVEVIIPEQWTPSDVSAAMSAGVYVGGVKEPAVQGTSTTVGAMPGHTVKVKQKSIYVQPPPVQKYDVHKIKEKQTLEFDEISIGGQKTTPQDDQMKVITTAVDGNKRINDSMNQMQRDIIQLTETISDHLSKRQFIN